LRVMQCDVSALMLPDSDSGELRVTMLHNPDARGPMREGYLPLVGRNRVVGVLMLSRRSDSTFEKDDVILLEQVARQVAIAVENTLEYEKAVKDREKETKQRLYLGRKAFHSCIVANRTGSRGAPRALVSALVVSLDRSSLRGVRWELVVPPHKLMQGEGDFVRIRRAPDNNALQLDGIVGDTANFHQLGFDDLRVSHCNSSMAHVDSRKPVRRANQSSIGGRGEHLSAANRSGPGVSTAPAKSCDSRWDGMPDRVGSVAAGPIRGGTQP